MAGAGGSLGKSALVKMYTTKEMITKSKTAPNKCPYLRALTVTFPAASVDCDSTICASRQSPAGMISPTTGINMSSTTAETSLPVAPPMITPIAKARALAFVRNETKSLSISRTAPPDAAIILGLKRGIRKASSRRHNQRVVVHVPSGVAIFDVPVLFGNRNAWQVHTLR